MNPFRSIYQTANPKSFRYNHWNVRHFILIREDLNVSNVFKKRKSVGVTPIYLSYSMCKHVS